MLSRILLLLFVTTTLTYAEPSLAQVKQAVAQNPGLLNTPQAKAMMAEKGVTASEVKQKLAETSTDVSSSTETSTIDNNISTTVEETSLETKEELVTAVSKLSKNVNPFKYKSNSEIQSALVKKQQLVSKGELKRYSTSFYANKNRLDSSSLPTPDDYIMSVGDVVSLHVYGDRDQKYSLKIKNNGTIDLAYIGPLKIGGMKYIDAKKFLTESLKKHFKMSRFNIQIDKYSTIQVTLIGDVKYPGLYNLSSFSTVKDLLIVAKGVRKSASVRNILVKRNSKVIAKLDFYDLLFKGKPFGTTLLKHGDIVLINQAKKLVSIDGYVNHASLFELKGKETLQSLIDYAGGLKPDASKSEIKISRYYNNTKQKTFKVAYRDAKNFKVRNGDSVYIYPLDFTAKESINVYGNVIRPGTYSLNSKRTLNEFFKEALSGGIKKFFLPNTYFEYGVIEHYSEDLEYKSQSFNLANVINGSQKVKLNPNDKIYIYGKNDIFANSYIITKGKNLVKSGKLQYVLGMTLQDAINASGIDGVLDDKVRVTTYDTEDYMPKTAFYSLQNQGKTLLSAYDEVEVYDYYSTHILEPVSIRGEVVKPSTVFYEKGMNVADLLVMAGGLTKRAYTHNLEIVRYSVDENQTRQRKILKLDLTAKEFSEINLEAYDEVRIFKIPKWNDNRSIILKGEVKFPGKYSIENGEKLSSVLARAGGFTNEAFIQGGVFTRDSIRKRQVAQYNQSLARIKRELAIYNAMPANAKTATTSVSSSNTLNEVMIEAQKYQPIGRVSIELQRDIVAFKDSKFDLVLKDLDTITIPNQIDTVTVFGEVFNATSFVYDDALDGDDYIEMASGLSRSADKGSIYVIHADGMSEILDSGWFSSCAKIQKGDTIVVPLYIQEYNTLEVWNSVAKVLSSFAVTAAALTTLGVI